MKTRASIFSFLQKYFLAGVLTTIPLLVTWWLVNVVWRLLRSFGEPIVHWISLSIEPMFPALGSWLMRPWFQAILAVLLVVTALVITGWLASRYVGRKILSFFDSVMDRVPMVRSVYGSVKKLLDVIQTRPDGVRRVVLIDFPSRDMKTVGLVTRTLVDEDTGRILAAVYVPTTPNPTSGYLEIVPLDKVISTNWSFDEAMSFIISGGAVAPSRMNFDKSVDPEDMLRAGAEDDLRKEKEGSSG